MSEGDVVVAYSQIADEQLDALEETNPALYNYEGARIGGVYCGRPGDPLAADLLERTLQCDLRRSPCQVATMTILVTTPPHHAPSYVLDVCEVIAEDPGGSQLRVQVIQTTEGIRFCNGVPGAGISVFWSLGDDGPRVEAVFPWSPSSR